uniref:Uncharacterized protein n=1 Tax=Acrobeloides nanus TaxID=290746 RepID=A0A914D552_9BILA
MIRPKDRLWISNLFGGNPVIILYACLAYFCGDWRILARASSALTIPAIILCCFISESPRYLIQKGRIAAAKAVLKRIHRIDGRPFHDDIVDSVLDKENK